MNLDKLFIWIAGIVLTCAATGQLGALQRWIYVAQAKVLYESRASAWGSPKFFPANEQTTREHTKRSTK